MTIFLNGQARDLPAERTLSKLLQELGLEGKPVVVELNGEAVLRTAYEQTTVQDQANVEIITLAAGG
jgi:thiamine biosynthesis protein ThiS